MKLIKLSNELVRAISTSPDIWERIRVDGVDKVSFTPPCSDLHTYLGFEVNNTIIGYLLFSEFRPCAVNVHIAILPEYRHLTKDYTNLFITYKLLSDHNLFIAEIPKTQKDTCLYCLRCGYKKIGEFTRGLTKDGKEIIFNQYIATKEDLLRQRNK